MVQSDNVGRNDFYYQKSCTRLLLRDMHIDDMTNLPELVSSLHALYILLYVLVLQTLNMVRAIILASFPGLLLIDMYRKVNIYALLEQILRATFNPWGRG